MPTIVDWVYIARSMHCCLKMLSPRAMLALHRGALCLRLQALHAPVLHDIWRLASQIYTTGQAVKSPRKLCCNMRHTPPLPAHLEQDQALLQQPAVTHLGRDQVRLVPICLADNTIHLQHADWKVIQLHTASKY